MKDLYALTKATLATCRCVGFNTQNQHSEFWELKPTHLQVAKVEKHPLKRNQRNGGDWPSPAAFGWQRNMVSGSVSRSSTLQSSLLQQSDLAIDIPPISGLSWSCSTPLVGEGRRDVIIAINGAMEQLLPKRLLIWKWPFLLVRVSNLLSADFTSFEKGRWQGRRDTWVTD